MCVWGRVCRFDIYGVVPAFTDARGAKTAPPPAGLPPGPATRAQWWFDIVRKHVADVFVLSLTPSPPLQQVTSRVSFLRSDLAASYET